MTERIVPWVTRWSGEVVMETVSLALLAGDLHLVYTNPRVPATLDDNLVLWQYEDNTRRGLGEPEFSQVSTFRQRICMLKRRCQVCGRKIPEGPISWLVLESMIDQISPTEVGTMSPPTCDACVRVAVGACPRLGRARRDGGSELVVAKVSRYTPWGAYGEVAKPDHKDRKLTFERVGNVGLPFGHRDTRYMLAKQMVVRWDDYEITKPYQAGENDG